MIRVSINIAGKRLSDTDFTLVNISQQISAHHYFSIRLKQDPDKEVLMGKTKDWIGKPLSIGIDDEADNLLMNAPLKDVFKGIITSVGLSRQSGTAELTIQGYSPTKIADSGPNTRSFTDKTLQEIANDVFGAYKFPAAPQIDPKVYTDSLPYSVQYRESDFVFINRLANSFGEWFYYDGLEFFLGKPANKETIELDFGERDMLDFSLSVRAVPQSSKFAGYDYLKHEQLNEETPQKFKSSDLGKIALDAGRNDIFSGKPLQHVQMAIEKDELKQLAKRYEEVQADETVVLSGSSRNPKLKIGAHIDLKDSALGENFGTFIITYLSHSIGQGGDYQNSFEAIPEETAIQPLNMLPEPPFCEAQLAVVTDIDDEKSLGRVRVKFLWQEGTEEKSPWIRVASPYTGKDKGFYITPEIDDQVLVGFENNHPDKPFVLTGMYNSEAKPEWFDVKNKFKGFKSKGGNKWKFDDNKKEIQFHAPESILMTAGKTIAIRTGEKGKDASIVMNEGKEITVSTNGKSDTVIKLDAGEGKIHIVAKNITIEASESIEMKAQKEIKMNGQQKVEVKSMEIKVEGSQKVDAKGAMVSISGSATVDVKGGLIKLN
jgi:type VI secretion system secreted protein VgrG